MASLDFKKEKTLFREYYDSNYRLLEDAKKSFIGLIYALIAHSGNISISKVEGRVKDKEECIKKFTRKYRTKLEENEEVYSIKDHITDLIGLRTVCLYEDDIKKIKNILQEHFEVIDVTDKIAQIEGTEGSFGYKGLHLDLKIGESRQSFLEYQKYAVFNFEIQIRTIIQDSWSILDHKIKYKKVIPNKLKRRINTLAALFELADREFREIRNSTEEEIKKAEDAHEDTEDEQVASDQPSSETSKYRVLLDSFGFLRIAQHFFHQYDFEPKKVDGFTQEIISLQPSATRGKFNNYMKENIAKVKQYKLFFENNNPNDKFNPFKIIRHCLYLGDKDLFNKILNNVAREGFDTWLQENG